MRDFSSKITKTNPENPPIIIKSSKWIRAKHSGMYRSYISVGQKVEKGSPLLNVISATLPIKTSDVEYKIEELQTKYNLWKSDLDWRILQYEIELKEQTSKIQSQIDQLKIKLNNNKELSKKIKSL